MITLFTRDRTTAPKAMPMITATARSMTLPRSRNFLRSWSTAPPRSPDRRRRIGVAGGLPAPLPQLTSAHPPIGIGPPGYHAPAIAAEYPTIERGCFYAQDLR